MVTGKYQVMSRLVKDGKYLKYTDVSDDILHSIWMEMDLVGIHTSVQKLGGYRDQRLQRAFQSAGPLSAQSAEVGWAD